MTTIIVIGVLWLAATALLAVTVARAIRTADQREERRVLAARTATRAHDADLRSPGESLSPGFDGFLPPSWSSDLLPPYDPDRPEDDAR